MKKTSFAVAATIVGIGLALRFLVALAGHNLDFESFQIVAGITARGGNVYAETARYNYGPIWFGVLRALHSVSPSDLRLPIVALLSLTDTGIFLILWRRFGPFAAFLFFLNPIS